MYGLPKNISLDFLLTKDLESVGIAPNQMILNFSGAVKFHIMSECTYKTSAMEAIHIESYPSSASLICKLIGSSITEASGENDGTLMLKFSNGDALTIHDDNKQYESYSIRHDQQIIVV